MSKILNAEAVLRSAIQLYADRDGLTEQEINGLANGDNRIREMLSFLSDG